MTYGHYKWSYMKIQIRKFGGENELSYTTKTDKNLRNQN